MSFSLTNFHSSLTAAHRAGNNPAFPTSSFGRRHFLDSSPCLMDCTCSSAGQSQSQSLEDDDRESFSSSAAMRWVEAQGEPHQLVSSEGGALLLAILYSCACTDSALDCRGLCATLWESPPLRVAPLSVPPPRGSFPSAHRRG